MIKKVMLNCKALSLTCQTLFFSFVFLNFKDFTMAFHPKLDPPCNDFALFLT